MFVQKELFPQNITSQHARQKGEALHLETSKTVAEYFAGIGLVRLGLEAAGWQVGLDGKHSSAFWGFIEIVKRQADAKPKLILLENVNGWLTSNKGFESISIANKFITEQCIVEYEKGSSGQESGEMRLRAVYAWLVVGVASKCWFVLAKTRSECVI